MKLNEYQEKAMGTCLPESENVSYMLLNLVGEVGEFSSKFAKAIRKKQVFIVSNQLCYDGDFDSTEFEDELKKEAGDIFWQLSGLCEIMGWPLEEVAQVNLDNLASRQIRNEIDGDGDNR